MIYLPRSCYVNAESDGIVTKITIPENPASNMPVMVYLNGQRVSSEDFSVSGSVISINGDFSKDRFYVDFFISVVDEERAAEIKLISEIQNQLSQIKGSTGIKSTVIITPKSDFDISEIGFNSSVIKDVYITSEPEVSEFDFHNAKKDLMLGLNKKNGNTKEEQDILFACAKAFEEILSEKLFNARTIGCPTLGSFEQVQSEALFNGLPLVQASRNEKPARSIYKAYRSKNNSLRGLGFLKAYLQASIPNSWELSQLWQDKNLPYTEGMSDSFVDGYFLTSRLLLVIFFNKALSVSGVGYLDIYEINKTVQLVAPARTVIDILHAIAFEEEISIGCYNEFSVEKNIIADSLNAIVIGSKFNNAQHESISHEHDSNCDCHNQLVHSFNFQNPLPKASFSFECNNLHIDSSVSLFVGATISQYSLFSISYETK